MTNPPHITHCGLPEVDRIPFGMHACHFYSDPDQLAAALVPYFITGLRAKERCLWLTAPPLPAREAMQALRAAWNGIDDAFQEDEIRILDAVRLKGLDVVQLCLEEEERALAEGYNGLRIAGSINFLASGDWAAFMEREQAMTAHFRGRRIIALCSYAQCNDRQMREVMQAHHCALAHSETDRRLTVIHRLSSAGGGDPALAPYVNISLDTASGVGTPAAPPSPNDFSGS
jgi:hypothetical protein